MDEDEDQHGFDTADWLKAVGGLLFFVAGLLTWWKLQFGEVMFTTTAWDYNVTGKVPYVILVAIAVVTIIARTESRRFPRFLVDPLASLVAATIATAAVAYRFVVDGVDNDAVDATRGVGLYLALATALMVLVGCVLDVRTQRATVDEYEEESALTADPIDSPEIDRPSPPPSP